ncbi:ComEC/Rec2 family competence protein [Duganella sp. BuS-21]|uniref:ComEC/Rec2 family competence protein n=1 Tax=Duganella sp. BuS-21 TaxID=2943848 RepID=UPI0035A711FD
MCIKRRHRASVSPFFVCVVSLLGRRRYAYGFGRLGNRRGVPAVAGRDLKIIGTIDNLPYRFAQGVRFNFAVEQADGVVPPRIALSWYSGYREQVSVVPDVRPGERWQLTVRLQRPHGNANPHGFDYEAWLLEQGVRATGYIRVARDNRRVDSFVFSAGNVVEHSRALLRDRILAALPGRPYAGVIVALVVGDQRGIDLVAYIKVLPWRLS